MLASRASRLPCQRRFLGGALPRCLQLDADVEIGGPRPVRLDLDVEGQPAFVERALASRRDRGRADERVALVAQRERSVGEALGIAALLLEGVLDFEEVGEVAVRLDPNDEV